MRALAGTLLARFGNKYFGLSFKKESQLFKKGDSFMRSLRDQEGKIGYIILWLMGVPAGILILIFVLRGCT